MQRRIKVVAELIGSQFQSGAMAPTQQALRLDTSHTETPINLSKVQLEKTYVNFKTSNAANLFSQEPKQPCKYWSLFSFLSFFFSWGQIEIESYLSLPQCLPCFRVVHACFFTVFLSAFGCLLVLLFQTCSRPFVDLFISAVLYCLPWGDCFVTHEARKH